MRFPPPRDDASRFGSTSFRERGPQTPRKRMMAQGRKGHFMHDAKVLMARVPGKLDEQHIRAFLEGLFARGARHIADAARDLLK